MHERIYGKPLITQADMQRRVRELGRRIMTDYAEKDLVMIGVLKGAFTFFADLVRAVHLPLTIDFIIASRRSGGSKHKDSVRVFSDLNQDIEGLDVILVEDIVDSGKTAVTLRKKIMRRKPNSLRLCALLDKTERRKVDVPIEYVGFKIPNKYVVGYGLDYRNKYRNLPYIAVLDTVHED
jgi:hypoxanthine phosphoribosyltransferase